jgi:hypothetical protein
MHHAVLESPSSVFGAWDEYTPAKQLNGNHQLAIKNLRSGDTLTMEFYACSTPELELEFFQIDMYFTTR